MILSRRWYGDVNMLVLVQKLVVMISKANDVLVGMVRSRRLFQLSSKRCNDSERDD